MYGVFCVLLMTGLIFLTFLHMRSPWKWLTVTEGILTAAGVLLHLLLPAILHASLSGRSENFVTWAWDSLTAYLQYSLPALGIFFGLTVFCALSALWEKKYRSLLWVRLRSVCLLACSVFLLVLAWFFGLMSATDSLPLESCIQAFGVAGVLVLRGMYLAEALWQRKHMSVQTFRKK